MLKNRLAILATGAAVVATGAILFGGQAVSTAFSSDSATHYAQGDAANTGVTVDNGDFDAKGLVPGAAATPAGDPVITNTGSTPQVMTVSFGSAIINHGNPDLSELIFNIAGQDLTAAQLQNNTLTLPQSPFAPKQSVDYTVTERLAQGTGNEWNGASVTLPYTVHGQAGN